MTQQPSESQDTKLLERLIETHVFVIGDLILDRYIEGHVSRISPEAPVPVLLEKNNRDVLGGAGNVAANIAAFGARVTLSGVIGADHDGNRFQEICQHHKIDAGAVLISQKSPTTRKTRVIAGYQQVVRIDHEELIQLDAAQERTILKKLQDFSQSKGLKSIVISDYGKGVLSKSFLKEIIAVARSAKIPVITDPKSLDMERYSGSTIIKPNLSEGRALLYSKKTGYEKKSFDQEAQDIANMVLEVSHAEHVILSLSDKGVLGIGKTLKQPIRFASQVLEVADVSGAGDTMIAFLAMGSAANFDLVDSVKLANTAAGVVCRKLGTATVSESELRDALLDTNLFDTRSKIVDREDLKTILEEQSALGRKISFTNGCFDLLHPGHITFLQKCRSFGDLLVVAVNSDSSVKKLKGANRPIQTFVDRAHVLSGLSCVDFVCEFDEDTPLETIKYLKPNIIAKGADYSIETTVGSKEVLAWGGRVEIIDLVAGKSTTSLANKMKGS